MPFRVGLDRLDHLDRTEDAIQGIEFLHYLARDGIVAGPFEAALPVLGELRLEAGGRERRREGGKCPPLDEDVDDRPRRMARVLDEGKQLDAAQRDLFGADAEEGLPEVGFGPGTLA